MLRRVTVVVELGDITVTDKDAGDKPCPCVTSCDPYGLYWSTELIYDSNTSNVEDSVLECLNTLKKSTGLTDNERLGTAISMQFDALIRKQSHKIKNMRKPATRSVRARSYMGTRDLYYGCPNLCGAEIVEDESIETEIGYEVKLKLITKDDFRYDITLVQDK